MVASATLSAITTGYSVQFREGLTSMSRQLNWMQFATEETSTDATTVYPIKGRSAAMREWVGDRLLREGQVYGYSLTNKKFEDTVKVKVDDVEDDKWGLYNTQIRDLGEACGRLPWEQLATAIINGGSKTCYDGEYFFDTDHPQDPFGSVTTTWANLLTSTSLTAANVATTRTAMRVVKDAYGVILGVTPTHLVVPSALEKTAEEIVGAQALLIHRAGTSTSDTSSAPSNVLRGQLGIIVMPELDASSSTTWYMADLSKALKPLMWQWRARPVFQQITDQNAEYVVRNDEFVFGAKARGAAGYVLPQLMFKCTA